jgi:hypothetical protein
MQTTLHLLLLSRQGNLVTDTLLKTEVFGFGTPRLMTGTTLEILKVQQVQLVLTVQQDQQANKVFKV